MQIQATKEKELCTARTGLSIAEQGIRVSEEHLTALHMDSDEECDENYDLQKAAPLFRRRHPGNQKRTVGTSFVAETT